MSDTKRTTPAPPSASQSPKNPNLDCPDWCERTDHEADFFSDETAIHYGPEFADGLVLVAVQGTKCGPLEAVIYLDADLFVSDPCKLRAHASELLKAAEWLEANQ
jgi:hypothetical protein